MSRFALQSIWRFYRFERPELEQEFEAEHVSSIHQACHLWAVSQALFQVPHIVGSLTVTTIPKDVVFWTLFAATPLLAVIAYMASRRGFPPQRLSWMLGIWINVSLACTAVQLSRYTNFICNVPMAPVLDRLDADLAGSIRTFLHHLVIFLWITMYQAQLVAIQHVGFCPGMLLGSMAGPLIMVVFLSAGLSAAAVSYNGVTTVSALMALQLVAAINVSRLRRAAFVMKKQKASDVVAAQRADSIISHILKNAMAEAKGCIETFLDLCVPAPPPALVADFMGCAMDRLHSGMGWCKRRQVVVALMDECPVPNLAPHNLGELCSSLTSHRTVSMRCPDVRILLDGALTDVMLENAISNAFRHGHPVDPNVQLIVSVKDGPQESDCCVTFTVTNLIHPERPSVTPLLVASVFCNDDHQLVRSSPLSEGLGLRHSFLAAHIQGMTVNLRQDGDTVIFEAILPSAIQCTDVPSTPFVIIDCGEDASFPADLHICVIDDSASARKLLYHQLTKALAPRAVETFGKSEVDVAPFIQATLTHADIAILDQHLDWPSGNPGLGTQLVTSLLNSGFGGFICIRSANAAESDVDGYMAAGAHCVLDKLLDRDQMICTLKREYMKFATHKAPSLDVGVHTCREEAMTFTHTDEVIVEQSFPGVVPAMVFCNTASSPM